MSDLSSGMTPRPKPLPQRRSSLLPVVDIGSHKVVCLIAELDPVASGEAPAGRTHRIRVIGIGHQRSAGLRRGAIVDLESAEQSIRHAIDAAERMAKVEVRSAIVALNGGRLWVDRAVAAASVGPAPIAQADLHGVVAAAARVSLRPGRVMLHTSPVAFGVDAAAGILEPTGMIGQRLTCDVAVVSSEQAAVRNLMLAVERCHVEVEAMVATPYAAALACLVDDEGDMGAVVVDLGAGSTGIAAFEAGRLVHVDAIAVGGHHVTMDIARGLSMRVIDAERLKTQQATLTVTAADERDIIAFQQVDEGDRDVTASMPKARLTRIVRPRVEEILEVVRDRLAAAGFSPQAGRRVVFTGGASQLTGLVDLARTMLGAQVRLGKPLGVKGLPEAGRGPAYSAAVGLLVYPQVAAADRVDIRRAGQALRTGTDGYLARVSQWLRDSF